MNTREEPAVLSDIRLARVTLAERTAEVLRNQIVWGELPPGGRLVETDLAQELGISRTPIRQALQRLETDGLVVRQGGRGLIVAPFDRNVAVETLIMRELLEPFAAQESAPRLTGPELARLQSILSEMSALVDSDRHDPRNSAELNMEFHRLLNSRCPYPRIIETIQVARDGHSAVRLYSSYTNDDLHRVHREHTQIIDATLAVVDRTAKPERLGALIRDHMREARMALLRNTSAEVDEAASRSASMPSRKRSS